MNKNKLNDIRIYLNELKLAFKNPRLYIANYFDELQNQIDVDYELFQQKVLGHKEDKFDQDLKNLIHSENSQQANDTDEVILNRAREQLELMTDQVKHARLSCYTHLKTDQFNDNLLMNIAFMSKRTKYVIDTVESFIIKSSDLEQDEKIYELSELVEDTLINIQKALFLNKGIIFLSQELLVRLLLECYSLKWEKFYRQSFGYLIRIEDTFISKNYFKNYESKTNKYLEKRFAEQDLKIHLLISKLEFENKGTISLCMNKLKTLNFNDFYLNKLDVNLFNGLDNLEQLALNNNTIESLDPRLLWKLKKLRVLNLHNNKIDILIDQVFYGLSNISRLYLSKNRLSSLEPKIFKGLENLEVLHLFNNQLKELNLDVFKGLSHLKILNLEGNLIEHIEVDFFVDLFVLTNLNLSNNKLTKLGDDIFENLVNLKELDLSKNQLDKIKPDAFKGLGNLEYLFLNNNKELSALDSNVFKNIYNLKILNLSDCGLEVLDKETFQVLTKLEFVNLSRNKLFNLETEFFDTILNLKYVDFHKNQLDKPYKPLTVQYNEI